MDGSAERAVFVFGVSWHYADTFSQSGHFFGAPKDRIVQLWTDRWPTRVLSCCCCNLFGGICRYAGLSRERPLFAWKFRMRGLRMLSGSRLISRWSASPRLDCSVY